MIGDLENFRKEMEGKVTLVTNYITEKTKTN